MITGSKVRLRNKRVADARDDYIWQSDHELAQLDAAPQLNVSYTHYLLDYAWELRFPSSSRHRFAIENMNGTHIGNCSYYDINKTAGEAELGIMIGHREHWDQGYGTDAVATLVNHIFEETKLDRIYLKTLVANKRAQKCFQKCGFLPYSSLTKDGYEFVLMELLRQQWHRNREQQGDAAPSE